MLICLLDWLTAHCNVRDCKQARIVLTWASFAHLSVIKQQQSTVERQPFQYSLIVVSVVGILINQSSSYAWNDMNERVKRWWMDDRAKERQFLLFIRHNFSRCCNIYSWLNKFRLVVFQFSPIKEYLCLQGFRRTWLSSRLPTSSIWAQVSKFGARKGRFSLRW